MRAGAEVRVLADRYVPAGGDPREAYIRLEDHAVADGGAVAQLQVPGGLDPNGGADLYVPADPGTEQPQGRRASDKRCGARGSLRYQPPPLPLCRLVFGPAPG
ncbi:MAG: hypothetical protein ACREYC_04940 [Gammaproteobacteria bacterium]